MQNDPLGTELQFLLHVAGARHEQITSLIEELAHFEDVVARANKAVLVERGGRPVDIEFHVLLAKLKGLFERATGKHAGITWNDYADRGQQYTGQFFDFVSVIEQALARHRGVPARSNWALGDLVRQVSGGRPSRRKRPPQEA